MKAIRIIAACLCVASYWAIALPVWAQAGFGSPFLGGGPAAIGTLPAIGEGPPSFAPTPTAGGAGLPGTPIDRVELPNAAGVFVKGYKWATPHFLMVDGAPFLLVEYTGGVLNGKASGQGRLLTGTPPPPPQPGVIAGYGNPFGEEGFIYEGQFQNGLPSGKGLSVSRMTNQSVRGEYSGFFKINGQGVMSVGDTPILFARFADGELADGPYRRLLYTPSGSGPSHEFVGTLANGYPQGEWKRLDWEEQVGSTIYSSKNGTLVVTRPGESTVTCTPLMTDLLPAPMLPAARDVPEALQARNDPTVTPRHIRCEEPVGAKGNIVYEVIAAAGGTTVKPVSCSNEHGRDGTLASEKNKLICRVPNSTPRKGTDPITQMWRDLKKMF